MRIDTKRLWTVGVCTALVACGGGGGGTGDTAVDPGQNAALVAEVSAFIARLDADRATALPSSGAAMYAHHDACYLNDGWTKAAFVAGFDADPQAVDGRGYLIGSTRHNLVVLAQRTLTNGDGSSRREVDVQYDIHHADGTVNVANRETLIHGSSAGSTLLNGAPCATPESRAEWRFHGNRRVVRVSVHARNVRTEYHALDTGASLSPGVGYSKYIGLLVSDPGRVATYATVSGPGLTVNGQPAVFKLLSPRILRDDPLLAGKTGHEVDAQDTDAFRVCRTAAGGYAEASQADCVRNGASGSTWGAHRYLAVGDADAAFDSIGLVAGGIYTFTVYADDGWKTVNGQAGKVPIATYTATLKHLPYSAAALAAGFPSFTALSSPPEDIASAVRSKSALAVDATWSAPGVLPDGGVLGLSEAYAIVQGQANAQGRSFPSSGSIRWGYPDRGATRAQLPALTAGASLVTPVHAEIGLNFTTRDGNVVTTAVSFFQPSSQTQALGACRRDGCGR